MAAIELVVADTLSSRALVPMFIATATPMAARKIGGSSHDSHIISRTASSRAKAISITPRGAVVSCSLVSTITMSPYLELMSSASSC